MEPGTKAMHVAINTSRRTNKAGVEVTYQSALIRRTYRQDGKVKHETLGNISYLPQHAIEDLQASLKGKTMVDAAARMHILRSLPHGHIDAITTMAHGLGFESLLGPACRNRDLIMALLTARICKPTSKLATLNWFTDTTLGTDLGPVSSDDLYAAMDWLLEQQPRIEKQLARTHLGPEHNPEGLALFDLSSSWVTGTHNPLAKFGYSRDKKRGCEQIEYGMLATRAGLPIAVRVFPGNTSDPASFIQIASEIQDLCGVRDLVLAGDRGMITNARIEDLKKDTDFSWVTGLRNTDIQKLAEDNGPLQMSLFDEQNLAEISHPKYPHERLIACRNPALATKRAHKRTSLLEATEEKLETIKKAVEAGRLKDAGKIGVKVGKILGTYNMAKHFILVITDEKFAYERNTESIKREADLDGIYVIRTNVPETTMDAPEAVRTYKSLANVEKIFKTLKTRDLGIRPIRHYTEDRTRAHVFLCMLAAHLTWHLRTAWAPLTFTDENRPVPQEPVAKVVRSAAAARKASTRKLDDGTTATSYQDLLTHMGTRTRNTTSVPGTEKTFELLSLPTPRQQRAMDLIDHHVQNHRK
ncbi:IS1634 family transposase [Paeniglutamicibacter gangotriensis]|uniref:IS1634 family transposase n=1 Tax=Paeniglutamicibacter gangotriensis TaxID=254787 RepID=A0A5B0E6Z8_9MICC|nr:IS1634 family transposase [Paeniglutamicibacter gangotriensis]KAA0973149.1 IS1634 family transposase [Paeniglutamicibacter gangotriensis]